MTKEKIDRQLAEEPSSTPFVTIKDSHTNNKKVTFDTKNGLEEKTDRLTMMISKLSTKEEGLNKQFKPKIYQSTRREQSRNIYDGCNYQNGYRPGSGDRTFHLVVGFNVDRIDQDMNRISEEAILEVV